MKTCNACKKNLPVENFYTQDANGTLKGICKTCFNARRRSAASKLQAEKIKTCYRCEKDLIPDGKIHKRKYPCDDCKKQMGHEYRRQYEENAKKKFRDNPILQYDKATKICTVCKIELSIKDFDPRPERGGAPKSACRECSKAKTLDSQRKAHRLHPEKQRIKQQIHLQAKKKRLGEDGMRQYYQNLQKKNREKYKGTTIKERICCTCKENLPAKDFPRSVGLPGERGYQCKICALIAVKKLTFTRKQYLQLLEAQDYQCKICSVQFGPDVKPELDHKGKVVRGFLCHHCNMALGAVRDSVEILTRAKPYLQRPLTKKKFYKQGLKWEALCQEFLEKANHQCEICTSGQKLHLDHNHQTGMVRGILCLNCNFFLGTVKDNEQIVRACISYLLKATNLS